MLLLVIAMAIGAYARFSNLGERPLAEDEYYTVMGVRGILETGLPIQKSGGYYTRFLPLQYLGAATAKLFGDNEFSHRLLPAVFGLLLIPFFFLYARKYVNTYLACIGALIIAISSWEIEFSRFARMYTLFQLLAVIFFWLYYSIHVEKKENRIKYLYATSILLVTTHALGILILPFICFSLLQPLLATKTTIRNKLSVVRKAKARYIGGLLTLLFSFIYFTQIGNLFKSEPSENLPEGVQQYDTSNFARNAEFPFFEDVQLIANPVMAFMGIATIVSVFVLFLYRKRLTESPIPLGLSIMIVSSGFHLFALNITIFCILLVRYNLWSSLRNSRTTQALLAPSVLICLAWTAFALSDLDWTTAIAPYQQTRALRLTFLGFPDYYSTTVSVWMLAAKKTSILLFLSLAITILVDRKVSDHDLPTRPWFPILYMVFVFGLLNSVSETTRYWFFLYPTMLLVFLLALQSITNAIGKIAPTIRNASEMASAVVALTLFLVSDDVHARQILSPTSDDVSFRTGIFSKYESHWYRRFDERTPALIINNYKEKVDLIVVDGRLSAIDYYIDPGTNYAFYLDSDPAVLKGDRFSYRSRKRGTVELWTNQPLLNTIEEYLEAASEARTILLVRWVGEEHKPNLIGELKNTVSSVKLLGRGRDGKVEALLIERFTPNSANTAN